MKIDENEAERQMLEEKAALVRAMEEDRSTVVLLIELTEKP